MLSPDQYEWLKTRLDTNTDTAACKIAGITLSKLKRWRKNRRFAEVAQACRDDRAAAFHYLSLHHSGLALDALKALLESTRGSDLRAGLELFIKIIKGQPVGETEDHGDLWQILVQPGGELNIAGKKPLGLPRGVE